MGLKCMGPLICGFGFFFSKILQYYTWPVGWKQRCRRSETGRNCGCRGWLNSHAVSQLHRGSAPEAVWCLGSTVNAPPEGEMPTNLGIQTSVDRGGWAPFIHSSLHSLPRFLRPPPAKASCTKIHWGPLLRGTQDKGMGNPLQDSYLENHTDRRPGGLQSTGSQRLRHDRVTHTHTHTHTKTVSFPSSLSPSFLFSSLPLSVYISV